MFARFRTVLQNVVRKRFFSDLLPAGPTLPLWLYKHDAFVSQDLPLDHEHDESVMLCPKELAVTVLQNSKGAAHLEPDPSLAPAGDSTTAMRQQRVTSARTQRRVPSPRSRTGAGHEHKHHQHHQHHQHSSPHQHGDGVASPKQYHGLQEHSPFQTPRRQGLQGQGQGTGQSLASRGRVHNLTTQQLYSSLKETLSHYFMDSEGRISTFQLRLPGAFVGTIAEIVDHLRHAKYRTNLLLRMPRVKDIISLCASLSSFEVVFAEDMGEHARVRSQFVDLVMRAGTRDEKIIYAVSLSECPKLLLAMLSSFVTSGEIGDLLSPDNLVAVSTLSQPKVIQAGLQPSLKNSWAFFKRTIK